MDDESIQAAPSVGDVIDCAKHPVQCTKDGVSNAVSDTVGGAVGDALENLVNGVIEGVVNTFTYILTFWITTPTSGLSSSNAVGGSITAMHDYMSYITAFFAILGLLIAAAKMAWSARVEPMKEMLRMLAAVVFVQALALSATQMLLRGGDAFASWLIVTVAEKDMENSFASLIPVLAASGGYFTVNPVSDQLALGAMLIVMIVVLLSAIAQFMFLILRDVLLAIILAFLPTLAAASLTKGGSEAFEKAQGWIVALLLYKPTAAVIYSLGVLMVKGVGSSNPNGEVDWAALLLGTLTLVLATLAMPALIKFVAPAAGRGVSNAFSGGAAVSGAVAAGAGAVAMGASVAALAATGGASAPASGAAMSGAAGGTAGGSAGGAAGGGAGAASGGAGAAGTGVSGGVGTPGSTPPGGEGSAPGASAGGKGADGESGSPGASGSDGGSGAQGSGAGGSSESGSSGDSSGGSAQGSNVSGSAGADSSGGGSSGLSLDQARAVGDIAGGVQEEASGPSGSAIEEST